MITNGEAEAVALAKRLELIGTARKLEYALETRDEAALAFCVGVLVSCVELGHGITRPARMLQYRRLLGMLRRIRL